MKFEEALAELRKGNAIESPLGTILIKREHEWSATLSKTEFLSDKWKVYEEINRTFHEVFEAYKEGKKIRRISWENKNKFLQRYSERWEICLFEEDLLANDWKIIDRKD